MWGKAKGSGFFHQGVVFLFCLIDLLAFVLLSPYDRVGPQLLENPDFAHDLQGWALEGDGEQLQIENGLLQIDHSTTTDTTSLSQCHPADKMPEYLLLTAQGMSRGVVRGDAPWHEARIDLVGYDAQGKGNYRVRTRLLAMDGDQAWVEGSRVYPNTRDYRKVCVEISLYRASGSFQVRGLSLYQALGNSLYRTISLMLLAGWGVLALWLGRALLEYYRERPQGRYLLSVFVLLLFGVLMPQAMRSSLEVQILSLLSHLGIVIPPADTLYHGSVFDLWPQQWDISKVSHLLGFTLLSGILFTERNVSPVGRLFGLLLLAVATELLQFYVPDRTPRLSDVMVDGLGILMGWGAGRLFLHFRHKGLR